MSLELIIILVLIGLPVSYLAARLIGSGFAKSYFEQKRKEKE